MYSYHDTKPDSKSQLQDTHPDRLFSYMIGGTSNVS